MTYSLILHDVSKLNSFTLFALLTLLCLLYPFALGTGATFVGAFAFVLL
jgi:hypothetical protein